MVNLRKKVDLGALLRANAVTIGAMAAQISALWVIEWGISGLGGFLTAMAMTVPIAAFFGYLIGKLLNKMKGQEMIGGLILGYFANGLYQLLFLFIDGNYQLPAQEAGSEEDCRPHRHLRRSVPGVAVKNLFSMAQIPMVTFALVGLLCLFNNALMKTRLGQQFRAVGQNRTVANVSGINVDKVRLIAIVISTVLAGWGQRIFVQNMGSFQTYGAHEQVGLYAGAAILVGGASIKKATNTQALIGCILFHLLFIVAPSAGKILFGDATIGEYFRVFISYGVIALALVMHAWSGVQKKAKK